MHDILGFFIAECLVSIIYFYAYVHEVNQVVSVNMNYMCGMSVAPTIQSQNSLK